MSQTIAIEVGVSNDKRRRKALKLAAAAQGVVSVGLNGEDQVIVTGDKVDAVCLTNSLRRKLGCDVKLLSLQDVPSDDGGGGSGGGGGDGGDDGGGGGKEPPPNCPCNCNCCHFPPPPPYPMPYVVIYDADPCSPFMCSLM